MNFVTNTPSSWCYPRAGPTLCRPRPPPPPRGGALRQPARTCTARHRKPQGVSTPTTSHKHPSRSGGIGGREGGGQKGRSSKSRHSDKPYKQRRRLLSFVLFVLCCDGRHGGVTNSLSRTHTHTLTHTLTFRFDSPTPTPHVRFWQACSTCSRGTGNLSQATPVPNTLHPSPDAPGGGPHGNQVCVCSS